MLRYAGQAVQQTGMADFYLASFYLATAVKLKRLTFQVCEGAGRTGEKKYKNKLHFHPVLSIDSAQCLSSGKRI